MINGDFPLSESHTAEIYRTIVDHSLAAIFVGSPDGNTISFANPAACKMFGYSKAELLQQNRSSLFCCDETMKEAIKKRATTGRFSGIVTGIRKNGEPFPCEVSSVLFVDEDGQQKAIATIIDISEKTALEEELKKSNERYRLATQASFDAIWDADLLTNTITWGEGFETLFGYEVGNFSTNQHTWENNIHPDDRKRVLTKLNNILLHQPKQFCWTDEYRFFRADGSIAYVIDRGMILRDTAGHAIRMVGAMQDITALKQKEQELLKINNRFYTAIKATSDIVWDWDLKTNLVEWASNFTSYMGYYLPADFKLPLDFCYSNFHPDDRQRVLDSLQKAIEDPEQTKWTNEFRYRKADGSYAEVMDRAYILRDEQQKAYRLIGAMQDVTLLKERKRQLIQQEIQKQNAISQAILETQAKERTEIGKELHDNVNQLLTTSKLYLDLALSDPEKKSHFIQKSADQIVQVINEIRKLCETLMAPSLGDLGLIDSISGLADSINITKQITVHLDMNASLENLLSEHTKLVLYRIVQEALNNCLKYAHAKNIFIYLSSCKQHVSLILRDDGIGFEPEKIKWGTGLKNIQNRVYLFNGNFNLKTAPGQGCELNISVPLSSTSPMNLF